MLSWPSDRDSVPFSFFASEFAMFCIDHASKARIPGPFESGHCCSSCISAPNLFPRLSPLQRLRFLANCSFHFGFRLCHTHPVSWPRSRSFHCKPEVYRRLAVAIRVTTIIPRSALNFATSCISCCPQAFNIMQSAALDPGTFQCNPAKHRRLGSC